LKLLFPVFFIFETSVSNIFHFATSKYFNFEISVPSIFHFATSVANVFRPDRVVSKLRPDTSTKHVRLQAVLLLLSGM
jgi:hypothetical protein